MINDYPEILTAERMRAHERAIRILRDALTVGDPDQLLSSRISLKGLLERRQLEALVYVTLGSLENADAEAVVRRAIGGSGYPDPIFLDAQAEAALWAAASSAHERRAYCGAAFKAMSRADQNTFLEWARKRP